ncbi:MAG: class I SAM-dependent methyltransferase [Pirellulales bacterium]
MPTLPPGFDDCFRDIRESLRGVEGWLSDREAQFLAMLAACPTGEGHIVEIGSFRGRSTIALAKAAALADGATVHTVDIRPPAKLEMNLERAGVRDRVAVYHMRSQQMLANWRRPVRLLWCDGPIDRATVSQDFELLRQYLVNGAVVAFHDVLNMSGARIWVFAEKVLQNPHFGPVGVCGSIGWGQFRADPRDAKPSACNKRLLHARLLRLYPFHESYMGRRPPWPARIHYKLLRSLIPHGRTDPREWIRKVA